MCENKVKSGNFALAHNIWGPNGTWTLDSDKIIDLLEQGRAQ